MNNSFFFTLRRRWVLPWILAVILPDAIVQAQDPKPAGSALTADGYIGLLEKDASTLPADQKKVVDVLNAQGDKVLAASSQELQQIQQLSQNVITPLNNASNAKDLETAKSGVDELRAACQKTRSNLDELQTQVSKELEQGSLQQPLAGEIALKFVDRARAFNLPRNDASLKVADDVSNLIDVLAKNPKKWKKNGGQLSFSSQPVLNQFQTLQQKLKEDINTLNSKLKAGS